MNRTEAALAIPFVVVGLCSGCTGAPARVQAPEWNVKSAVSSAFDAHDRDKNGRLAGEELTPGLREALVSADRNKDGSMSMDELTELLDGYVNSRVGLQDFSGQIHWNGTPLEGAAVTFVPEKFLDGTIKEAKGVTDAQGRFALQTADVSLPGVRQGIYLIRIEKKNAQGAELVPAKYNAGSMLGAEIGPNQRSNFSLNLVP